MTESIDRYLQWIATEASQIHSALLTAVESSGIEQLQHVYGESLPLSLAKLYSVFGGQPHWAEPMLPSTIDNASSFIVLPPDEACQAWKDRVAFGRDVPAVAQMRFTASPGVRAVYWNPGWFPFASNGSTCLLCVDMAPTERGVKEQVIAYWDDLQDRVLVANSVGAVFESALAACNSGRAAYLRGLGVMHSR